MKYYKSEVVIIASKTGKYIKCEYCGNEVYKTLSQYNKREHHFCSNKCQSMWKRQQTFEYRVCEICRSEFYVSKKSTQRFCSITCQHKWQLGNTGFKNPKFQGGYVVCENCGKIYSIGKYRLEKTNHHFCSSECRQKWYSAVWSKSDEWRDKSRERAVRILSQCNVSTMTKPQIAVNKILDDLSVQYRNEEPFVYYSIDNYLTEFSLAIEVMGDYWHGSPLKYDSKLNEIQKNVISRDKAKRTYIKKYHDIDILYLWESDIINKSDVCAALIKLYISRGGNLENYHSFNYRLNGDKSIILNQDIIFPHQERKIVC